MKSDLVPKVTFIPSRRDFLARGTALVGGVLVSGPAVGAGKGCRITEADVLGPFYRFGAPHQTKLAGPDDRGDRLILNGSVFSSDCRTPLAGALIEVWQANSDGQYDVTKPGNFTEVSKFHLRAILQANDKGRYEIETIVPGRYPIPPGLPGLEKYAGLTRPAHIHFRVIDALHVPVTTQLYFKGDPYLAKDPWGGHKKTQAVELKQDGTLKRCAFDIVLARGEKNA